MNLKITISASIIILCFMVRCESENNEIKDIAVVNAKYDDIKKILSKYGIQYKLCPYSDLEKKEIFDNYRAIFFPCGVENPIETNVNIMSRGTRIHSVSLKKDFLDINEDTIYKNIKYFINNGGNAYFSDYSYKLLSGALKSMEFYDDFPNMGKSEKITLNIKGDLMCFTKSRSMNIDMPHPGWVVVKLINNSETLAESTFNTIRYTITSPIISLLKNTNGEVIYTSWHATGNDIIQRYIIYKLSYKYLSDKLMKEASFWQQDVSCTIVDSIREWENYRSYFIPVEKGKNTIYFKSENGIFQIDIYDKDNKFLVTEDMRRNDYFINIKSDFFQYLNIKIFPSNPKTSGIYSIVSASGMKIIPYYKKISVFMIFAAIIAFIYWILKAFGLKKFSGRIRQK